MQKVKPKKSLGQHFLTNNSIAEKIVDSIEPSSSSTIIEVGPGMGILTGKLFERFGSKLFAIEIDDESIQYLKNNITGIDGRLIQSDFLKFDIATIIQGDVVLIGNFPYNISSQILFKVLEYKNTISEVVGMFQREVALRICEPPGSKTYGILSVLLQAFYKIDYLFTVGEESFSPPPKVKSAVIRLKRNQTQTLNCNEKLFFRVVKAAFNQRRKMLRNSIKAAFNDVPTEHHLFSKRPEQLSVGDFEMLTQIIENHTKT